MVGLKGDPKDVTQEDLDKLTKEIEQLEEEIKEIEGSFIPIEEIEQDIQRDCEIKALKEECEMWGIK